MPTKLRVLILEDTPADTELVLHELRRGGYEPEWKRVETEPAYLAQLEKGWEIILADYNLPQFTGLRALELLQARGLNIPLFIVSGTIGEDTAVAAMQAGASDYLMKDNLVRLVPAVERVLREVAERNKRKRTEVALRDSEVRYRRLFESAKEGILILDAETGMVVDVNPFLVELLGYSRKAFLEKEVWELGFIKHIIANQTHFAELQQKKYVRYDDKPLETKDGRRIDVEFVSNVYAVNHHKVIQCNIRDISARKRMDAALRESETRFRSLVEGAPDAIFVQSGGRFVYLNPAMLSLLGASSLDGLLGTEYMERIAPEWREAVRERIRLQRESGKAVPLMEQEYLRLDGSPVMVETTAVPVQFQGRDAHLVFARNVTERKRAEESHARLATAVEQASEVIVITDVNAAIVYVNPAFESITGYTRREALGQNPRILKSGKQDAEFYRKMWAALTAGQVWRGHMINKRKDGVLYEEDATISPVRDATGGIVNYVAVKRDVTREVQLEAQFRQAQKMEAVGVLAGGVAHDFNNLLTVINGRAELLLIRLKADDPSRRELELIHKTGERAAKLTRQLLAFSRRQVLQPKVINLNEVVADLEKMLRRLVREDILITTVLAPDLHPTKVDPGQIEQVLMNLVVNARDAMPKGGKLVIETANTDSDKFSSQSGSGLKPGLYVRLSVSDTGCGMTDEVKAHIFEPFFTTKKLGEGTGLGLATVYGIVKQSGGYLAVQSELGQGSTFNIYLPLAVGQSKRPTKVLRLAPTREYETLLLAEDDEQVRAFSREVLEAHGYAVIEATNGADALALYQQHRSKFALVVADAIMPKMNGLETAQHLRRLQPDIKVLLMSGYTDHKLLEDGTLSPGTRYLQKPFTPGALAHKVREVLDE